MEKSTVLAALTFVTLVSGLAFAAYQLWITEHAKRHGLGGPMLNRPSGTTAGKDLAHVTQETATSQTAMSPSGATSSPQHDGSRASGSDPSI